MRKNLKGSLPGLRRFVVRTSHRWLGILFALLLTAFTTGARANLLTPSTYTGFAGSPFDGLPFTYFHLENFETATDLTPITIAGVTATPVPGYGILTGDLSEGVHSVEYPSAGDGKVFQVTSASNPQSVTFAFDQAILGGLPTHAGLVLTYSSGMAVPPEWGWAATFQAYGPDGVTPIGTSTSASIADQFFGVTNSAGISKIVLSAPYGGLQVDHLQLGLEGSTPEPGTLALLATGLAAFGARGKRRRR